MIEANFTTATTTLYGIVELVVELPGRAAPVAVSTTAARRVCIAIPHAAGSAVAVAVAVAVLP